MGGLIPRTFLCLAKSVWSNPILSFEYGIKIRNRGETDTVTDGDNRLIGVLQLKGCVLEANVIQIVCHGAAHVLLECSADVGFAKMIWLQYLIQPRL